MVQTLLIFLSVLAFSLNSIMTRTFQVALQRKEYAIRLYQSLFCSVAALAYFLLGLINGACFSFEMLLPAILFGIFFAAAVLFIAACTDLGYMSLTAVIVNMSLLIPVFYSVFFLEEPFTPLMLVGLFLVLLTLTISSLGKGNGDGADIKRWLLFVVIAFLANGGSAVTQKIYVKSYGDSNLMLFMGIAYTVSALIFAVFYIEKRKKDPAPLQEQIRKPYLLPLLALISGIGSFGGNGLLGILSDKVDGGILYPSVNGGLAVTVALASFLIFKEKPTCKKGIAILTGIAAIIVLNF